MPSVIPVCLGPQSYKILIAPGSLEALGAWLTGNVEQVPATVPPPPTDGPPLKLGKQVLVVSNPMIFRHYGDRLLATLTQAGFAVGYCLLPAGERYKTLKSVQKIYDAALAQRLERSSTIVALGGGVIGDMAGFAAATWLRGINVVQVPTSLLAMVDAAIGGKTGVNHPQGKNLIGAFHQPRLVLIDPDVLATLPPREFRAAMAEVIKYGVIWDASLFERLEQLPRLDQHRFLARIPPGQTHSPLEECLIRSCQAKAAVVSQDEKEGGLRAILNYGHTIGHAVESLTGYRRVNHGEAVAIGMVAAGQLAVAAGFWSATEAERQLALIQKAGLPTQIPADLDPEAILASLQTDKKVKDGKVRFVLPTQIGAATVTDRLTPDQVRQVLPNTGV